MVAKVPPKMAPVFGSSSRPTGRELVEATDQIYGGLPPEATGEAEQLYPPLIALKGLIEILGLGMTRSDNCWGAEVPPEVCAVMLKVKRPDSDDVPLMRPVAGSMNNP